MKSTIATDKYFDSGFEDADQYEDIEGLIKSLEIQHTEPTLLSIRESIYQKMKLISGKKILEIGCGLGQTVRDIDKLSQHSTFITGLDKSAALLAEATKRTDMSHSNITFQQGDASNIPFEDNTFDYVCAERILMHTPNPQHIVSEMVRVLKHGGAVCMTEPDLNSVEIYPDTHHISRLIAQQWCDYTESPMVGKHLLSYCQEIGLRNINITSTALVINQYETIEQIRSLSKLVTAIEGNSKVTTQEASIYLKNLIDSSKNNKFMFYVNVYSIYAEK